MSNQFLKLRRSAVPGRVPSTSSIDFGEIALNTYDGLAFIKRSGSLGEEVITLGSREGAFTGSFSGSFVGNGAGLFNVPASGIVGLNLSQIATGSVSASVGVGASSFSVVSGSNTFLYVSSSGNAGIGTTSPTAKIHISGSGTDSLLRIQSSFEFNGAIQTNIVNVNGRGEVGIGATPLNQIPLYVYRSGYGELLRLGSDANTIGFSNGEIYLASATVAKFSQLELRMSNNSGNVIIRNSYGGPSSGISLIAPGNIILTPGTFDGSGNVGINTTSPTAKLDVSGSSRFIGNMTVTGSSYFLGPSDNVAFTIRSGTASSAYLLADIQMSGGASAFTIANNGAINAYSSITYGGQTIVNADGIIFRNATPVEIGRISQTNSETGGATNGYTSNQSRKFTFSHGIYASGGNTILGPLFADLGDRLQVTGSSRFIGNMVITGSGNTSATNALSVVNSSNSSLLTVRNDGNVGIGTNTPLNPLHVAGTARIDYIYMPTGFGSFGSGGGITIYADYIYREGYSATIARTLSLKANVGINFISDSTAQTAFLWQEDYATSTMYMRYGNDRSVTVGSNLTHTSSIFTIDSRTKGFLTPRMTAAQRLAITTPAQGLIVYDTGSATEGLWLYNSGSTPGWQQVLTNSGSQSISGSITVNNVTVTGTLTAQTIVAQTITSSTDYVSGSTIFGNSLSNTHQFTGSVSITGSLRLPYLTDGSVLFISGGAISQNNSNFFWDSAQSRLGIGTNSPTHRLQVSGNTILTNPPSYQLRLSDGTFKWDLWAVANVTNTDLRFVDNSGNTVMVLYNGGNVSIGNNSNNARLSVSGNTFLSGSVTGSDMLIRGSGNTSATNALTVQNSDGVNTFLVRNDGLVNVSKVGTTATFKVGDLEITNTTNSTTFNPNTRGVTFAMPFLNGGFGYSFTNSTGISDTANTFNHVSITTQLIPSSGNATYTSLRLAPTINQTGTAIGISRGLYVNPTLTSTADFRAIEWSNNVSGSTSWGLYGTGNALNYISGRVGIGASLPSNTTYLSVTGQITGGVISYGVFQSGFVRSDVTIYGIGIANRLNKSDSNTLPDYYNFAALGGGSISGAVTNEYGFVVGSGMTSATSSYGFYGDLASGTGRWNLYMNGTANNYLAGNLGIGTTSPAVSLEVRNSTIGELAYFRNNASNAGIVIGNITNVGYVSSVSSLSGLGFGINGGTTAIRIFTNSNVAINSAVDLGATFGVAGNTFISGTLDILDAEINYQRNNNVTTGSARLIASIPTASYNAAFFDYVIVSGSNARAGTVMSVWASSSVEWNETYTNDIGSTTDVSLYAAITGSSIGLFATSSINNIWTIKSLIRTI